MKRSRAGITLIEILISIMIFGVGAISIMTLFPLGAMNVRAATRYSRSAYLSESAAGDLAARDLLNKTSFQVSNFSPWYSLAAYTPWPYDPWVQDTPGYVVTTPGAAGHNADPIVGPFGAYRGNGSFNTLNATPHGKAAPNGFLPGPGLPVAYDPLWRFQTGVYLGAGTEARFASGIGFVRPDPSGGDPSAHGLQRVTNFSPFLPAANPNSNSAPDIFVSPEDFVLQSETDKDASATRGTGEPSPIVPDMTTGSIQNDWRYTWMFTGQQADATNGSVFAGDVVVFEGRPFGLNSVTPPFADSRVTTAVDGEMVVEAVFGYTGKSVMTAGGSVGYGSNANRVVLLRWPASIPDPELKTGGWIADVTYERVAATDHQRRYVDPGLKAPSGIAKAYYPYQRCYWYRIAKRTQAGAATNSFAGDATAGMREMIVWTATPLQALTLLDATDGSPYHVNAALVSPYVVNVFPKTVYTR